MKLALVNGLRQEAQPTLSGMCPACDQPMVARCGEIKVWHWAHLGKRHCDSWWENETEWHRNWKGHFPVSWQEFVHEGEIGEKHIADVKTERGWVIEFQHSYLKPEERRSRDAFYPKLIWVVDGTRRKRDRAQLLNAWNDGRPVVGESPVRHALSDNCVLLREWGGGNAPIFFDLGDEQVLWWLAAMSTDGSTYLTPYLRAKFIESHQGVVTEMARQFDEEMVNLRKVLEKYDSQRRIRTIQGFQQDLGRPYRRRRRF